jgi:hypothetical protein
MLDKMNPEESANLGMFSTLLAEAIQSGKDISQEQVELVMKNCLEEGAKVLLESLRGSQKAMLEDHASLRKGFQERLELVWSNPFDLYETCLVIAQELGEEFNSEHRPNAHAKNDLVFEVLTRLHGRACHLGSEILHLLRGGFASGAMGRWRVMHEVAIVMLFISEHGQDAANRYLLHEHIEGYKAAKEYVDNYGANGEITQEMLDHNERIRDELVGQFGEDFGKDTGWAIPFLPNKTKPSITNIEKHVNMGKARSSYRLASHPTHAGPKGILFNLELGQRPELILTGPSNSGLADPGANALKYLMLTTSTLLLLHPSEKTTMSSLALQQFVNEGVEAFMDVHRKVSDGMVKPKGVEVE